MKQIGTYSADTGSNMFEFPIGKQYTDVIVDLIIQLTGQSAGYLLFDETEVGFQTSGSFYTTENNSKQLLIHNFGGKAEAIIKSIAYGTQIINQYPINTMRTNGMPQKVGFKLRTEGVEIISGTAVVYAK